MANNSTPAGNTAALPSTTARARVHTRSKRLFSAVAIGAVSAVTASVAAAGGAAFAAPDYPSWNDVEKAKQNESTKQAEIATLGELLDGLAAQAATAVTTAQMAAEEYRITQDSLAAATEREASLNAQAKKAEAAAATSKMRAGLIAAHLAKSGGNGLSLNLFLSGNSADDLLSQLGTASKLSEQSEQIYTEARQDQNAAESLGDQAASATDERERLTAESKTTFEAAAASSAAAEAAYDTQQRRSSELFEQLALLKDTTAEAERSFHVGEEAAAAAKAFAQAQASAAAIAAAAAAAAAQAAQDAAAAEGSGSGSGSASGSGSGFGSGSGSGAATPVVPSVPSAPAGGGTTVPVPNASVVDTALAFASDQLGDRYVFGGSGPDAWDCSGLTKAAYAAAGVYIGTHSATDQYNTMARQGKLVSFAQVQVGDLVFWGSPGNYYHVAIYVGGGQVIEAPNPSARVRVHSIWSSWAVAPYVGRPAA
ncbi:NlpC/P60 family protein [Cryobacterium sp. TMS1-13-1]|uniref:C40 family peptidase n=1 Tax=Cryobacterium sp. TMS1-13-1 TaxID=1259220 RepID=UPI00106A1D88|nr:C40 family peptidase [Cryobacterium sp. TMS1-13-1]TFD24920.1 NlpC/P60 family protein [Cryobacterium sp. TMS1-13-1]